MSKKIDEFTFGIRHNELSKYKADGITLENLPDGYIDKFSEETIARAKKLKAKHQDKYSDEYYLEMAKKLDIRDMLGGFLKIGQKALIHCEVTDPKWAGYTYDEILQMEEDGFVVPKEILEWAHAKQQADETNYILVGETVDATPDTTLEDNVAPDDFNTLRTRSMQDIAKVEKAQIETQKLMDEYNLKAQGAKQIQEEKEDSYKDSMKEITDLAKEWKTLNDKQKNGTQLTNDEQYRLEELGKLLNGYDGKLTKEIQADNFELNSFLEGLESITEKVNYDIEIVDQTVRNARELSEWESKVYDSKKFIKVNLVKDIGLNSSKLKGLNVENISSVALAEAKDLNAFASEIDAVLSGDNNIKLAHFANNYTNLATQTENFTKNTMGEAFDKASEDKNGNNDNKDKYQIESMTFTYNNAQKAAQISGKVTSDTVIHQIKTISTNKKQKDDNKKSIKDILKLNKEVKAASEKHKEYVSEEEEFLKELEALQGQNAEGSTKEKVENVVEEPTVSTSSNVASQGDKTQNQTEVESSKQGIVANIKNVDDADQMVKDQVQKPLGTSIASTAKSEKTNKDLTSITNDLNRINNDLGTVSGQTLIIGVGTFAKSFITTAIGTYMSAVGIGLMPNPITHRKGVEMNKAGILLQEQGFKENINGLMAARVAGVGLVTSTIAGESHSAAKEVIKESASLVNANKKVFKETQEDLDIKSTTGVNETTQTGEQKSQASEQSVQESEQTAQAKNGETTPNSAEAAGTSQVNGANTPSETNKTTDDIVANQPSSEEQQVEENGESKNDTPNLSIAFGADNSILASTLTFASTLNLSKEQSNLENSRAKIEKETQSSKKMVKEIEKQTAQVVSAHKTNQSEAEVLGQQIEVAQNTIQITENAADAENAKAETENLNTQLAGIEDKDSKVSQVADKSIKSGIQQLSKSQTNAINLGKDIKAFNSDISKQLDIVEKTMVVGVGTEALGGLNVNIGSALIAPGTPMLLNPFTEPEGSALIAEGITQTKIGIAELVAGGVAIAASTAGAIINSSAQTSSEDSATAEKTANAEYKKSDKSVKDSTKALNDLGIDVEQKDSNNSNVQAKEEQDDQPQDNDIADNETTKAASATTNASINQAIESEDKADRKLARFNEESIIESRKKKKKVVAVSASSRNGK